MKTLLDSIKVGTIITLVSPHKTTTAKFFGVGSQCGLRFLNLGKMRVYYFSIKNIHGSVITV